MAKDYRRLAEEVAQGVLLDEPDFLKEIVEKVLQELLEAEMTEHIGAAPYERTAERNGHRNGHKPHSLMTRVGILNLLVPQDREGTFSTRLFSRYQRNEKALVLALMEMCVEEISTRKVKDVTVELCDTSFSKSLLSELAGRLDAELQAWRSRPLEGKGYPYMFVNVRYEKVRVGHRIVSQGVLAVSAVRRTDGLREILAVEVADTESEATYQDLFRSLKARGLLGLELVVSEDYEGLKAAVERHFQDASHQRRCQVHYSRNLLGMVSHAKRKELASDLMAIFATPARDQAMGAAISVANKWQGKGNERVTEHLEEHIEECLSCLAFPESHRRRIRTTNGLERFNQEIKRRTRVVRIFPNRESYLRLVTALAVEQSEEWITGRRYLAWEISKSTAPKRGKWTERRLRSGRGRMRLGGNYRNLRILLVYSSATLHTLQEVVQSSLLENTLVSMHPQPIVPVPQDTARVAGAAFPKGNVYMQVRDGLGTIHDDEDSSELFEVRGRPAITPWRWALVTMMQFSEGLSDRHAAEAVRARIDRKYALGLQLSDPGFSLSVLSEFRSRLVKGGKERSLLEKLLEGCKERGYLTVRGRARTDPTHVLGSLRILSKWERPAETVRAALNTLAAADPASLTEHADPEWFERYARRVEDQRLPKGKEVRTQYLKTVGADGMRLLEQLDAPYTSQVLKELAEVEILRQIWEQYYEISDGQIRALDPKEMPEGARRIESPYEVEARYSTKRSMSWFGYKVHLTESCHDGLPHLITDVHTTAATATDVTQLTPIQRRLAANGMLPALQLADSSYVCGSNLVSSHACQIDLIGPAFKDNTWQAKAVEKASAWQTSASTGKRRQ